MGGTDSAVRTISWATFVVAVIVALLLPLGQFLLRYSALAATTETKAEIKAESLSQLVTGSPETWFFQEHRLKELLARYPVQTESEWARITDARGADVAKAGTPLSGLSLERGHAIYDSGSVVGRVYVARSLAPLVVETLVALGIGLLLGGLVLLLLRVAPLKSLRAAVSELEREKERAEVTLHSIGDAVITTDADEKIEFLNPVAERLTGWSNAEADGKPLAEVFRLVNELTEEAVENPLRQALLERRIVPLANHTALMRRDGSMISIEDTAAPIMTHSGEFIGGVLVFHDVSAARDMAGKLSWQATHDALTGLVNRSEFERRLEALITMPESDKHHVLCYLDLDQFKIVNDTCGHVAGDELLKQLTALLHETIRDSDTLARLGGDEFGLLLEGCSLEKGQQIGENLLKAVSAFRFSWEDKIFAVGVSAGLVAITPATPSKAFALSAADAACYTAKDKGRGRLETYEVGGGDVTKRREEMDWVARITQAVDEDRLVLHGQLCVPIVKADEPLHLELLVRMTDATGKLVPPGSFMPAAERYDLMPAIDRWVIRTAFSSVASVRSTFAGRPVIFGVNLSGASINAEFLLDYIKEQAAACATDPRSICFEVTETVAINQLRQARHLMKELKSMGFLFALDDFGAGMSSFAYLKNLPVDYLKIDGAFVKEMDKDSVSRSMVIAINQIGHAMGLKTIAEWVENQAIYDLLKEIGVDFAQGYAIAKPMPLDEVAGAAGALTLHAQPVIGLAAAVRAG